ncbi:MAG: 3-phosphoshikimate 1-carboxyvinyltransferase [Candidatus Izimaplasma sp.]|nr:3-phosphoshikimate 1-carboxyvinyltransferase [Candidatus Izimaplasma bacterium]
MKVKIHPGFAKGEINVPPSKSMLHRAIISASLANGTSKISNVIFSEDIKATIAAFKQLGVDIKTNKYTLEISRNKSLTYSGKEIINCNESGSTLRFLIPILANEKGIRFTGKTTLMTRPLSVYETIFKENNYDFIKKNNTLYLNNEFKAGNYIIPGNISSQFITGLLFALPLKKYDSQIEITGVFESQNYVEMTIDILKKFGIEITKDNNIFYIKGNQEYKATDIIIESDYSQLAFFAVAGVINGDIKINNAKLNSLQPDKAIIKIIKQMNGNITIKDGSYHFNKSETKGIDIDVSQYPDIAPILSILAGLSNGKTNILNAKRLKIKETNRLEASYDVLKKLGVNVKIGDDSLSIIGQNKFIGNEFNSYNDHRMVMSIAIASLRNNQPITINNAEAINKSYPTFFEDLHSLGIKIEYM